MKTQNKEIRWILGLNIGIAAITALSILSGCGHNVKSSASPDLQAAQGPASTGTSPTAPPSTPGSDSPPTVVPSFVQVEMQDLTPPFPSTWQSIFQALPTGVVVREEEYFNPTEDAVVLWVQSSGSLHTHTEYHPFHTFQVDATAPVSTLQIIFQESGLKQAQAITADWVPIELGAKASVQFQWIAAISGGHINCDGAVGNPGSISPNFLQVHGNLHREVRVTAVGTPASVATGDAGSLNMTQADVLDAGDFPVNVNLGATAGDPFIYACWWQ